MSTQKMYTFGSKEVKCKSRTVARTYTTGTALAKLPKGSRLLAIVIAGTASDAGTSATLSFGTSATATEWVNGADVKTAAAGNGPTIMPSVAGTQGGVLTSDTVVYAKYAESGTASNVGAWTAHIIYTDGETTR